MKIYWDNDWKEFAKNAYVRPNPTVISQICQLFNPKGKKILELGAGSGGDAITLAKMGATVTTLDISPESTKLCQKLAHKEKTNISCVTGDCMKMSFPDNSFDLVFSVGLVEHFHQPLPVIQEQLRILKPGGFLLIDVPQKFNLYTIVKKIRMKTGSYPFGWETEYSVFDFNKISKKLNSKIYKFFGHDSAFTLKLPISIQPTFRQVFSIIEKSPLSPYICLNIGVIIQK